MNYKFTYLVNFQYLGFRLHGWQKQPDVKTVHFVVDKTLKFVLPIIRFKSVGIGRTDAKVSSTDYIFQLFTDEKLNEVDFIESFNRNSPSDVRVLGIEQLNDQYFNVIQHSKIKEYRYYFSYGKKNHPYSAPFLVGFLDDLNIELMKQGAKLFEGNYNFKMYCTKPSKETKVQRSIDFCEIIENIDLTASFFPEKSYVLIIKGKGFLRNQIRLIMGALLELGRGSIDLDFIRQSLTGVCEVDFIKTIAPASGLHLHKVELL